VNTTQTLVNETTGCVASPRPKVVVAARTYANAAVDGLSGRIEGSWLIATPKSMTVPTFHDRWPLCSST